MDIDAYMMEHSETYANADPAGKQAFLDYLLDAGVMDRIWTGFYEVFLLGKLAGVMELRRDMSEMAQPPAQPPADLPPAPGLEAP